MAFWMVFHPSGSQIGKAFLEFMKIYYPKIGAEIEQKGILTEENEASLQKAIQHFQSTWE
jgi:hypothetical protein